MNGPNVNVEVAAIKEASKHRDREIRDLKGAMKEVNDKLDSVITQLTKMHDLPDDMATVKREVKSLTKDRDEMTGSIRLGKWIVGTGLFGFVGSSAYGLWHILTGK
jgi:predicted  nucleic acid-binding Zn-ribbon protein